MVTILHEVHEALCRVHGLVEANKKYLDFVNEMDFVNHKVVLVEAGRHLYREKEPAGFNLP